MATFTFPLNPQVGNTYTVGSRTYRWTGYAWSIVTGTITTGNTAVTGNSISTGNTTITDTGLTTGNTRITGNSISTDSLFYANGRPYVTNSNIYNGSVSVATSLVMIDYAPIVGTTTVRWLLSATDNVNNRFKFSTIDCINNGTAAFFTEYAVLLSHPTYEVANYASNVTSGNIDLYAIGDSANITITYQRTTLGSSTQVGYLLQ